MKRNYPLFTIDRSKHSSYPFDYITCYDRTVGFIARVVHFTNDIQYHEYLNRIAEHEDSKELSTTLKLKKGGLVLVVDDFLYQFDWTSKNLNRVQTLLKKGFKKYMHAEVDRTPTDNDLGIDDQIKQQEETIAMAKANYESLVERSLGDKKIADYQIALAEATLDTLKAFRDNQKFINLN